MSLETPAGIPCFAWRSCRDQGRLSNARITYGGLGGKGLNQAIAAARAEMDVRLIAAVGNDSAATSSATRCGLSGLPLTHLSIYRVKPDGGCTRSRHSLNSPMKKYLYTCHRALGGDDGGRCG